MKDELIRSQIHQAVDHHSEHLQSNSFLAQRIINQERTGEPVVKKRLSIGLVLVIVLMLIAVTALKGRSGVEKDGSFTTKREASWLMFDAGCAVQTLCLAAYEKGLGTVIMGIFDDSLSEYLKIPEDRELVCLVCMGYPAQSPEAPRRKSVE